MSAQNFSRISQNLLKSAKIEGRENRRMGQNRTEPKPTHENNNNYNSNNNNNAQTLK